VLECTYLASYPCSLPTGDQQPHAMCGAICKHSQQASAWDDEQQYRQNIARKVFTAETRSNSESEDSVLQGRSQDFPKGGATECFLKTIYTYIRTNIYIYTIPLISSRAYSKGIYVYSIIKFTLKHV